MQAKAMIAIVAISAAFGAGFWLSDTLHDNESLRASSAVAVAQKQSDDKLRTALATVDKKHFEELTNARNENDKLRLDLASGAKRVRVAVRDCKATSTSGVDDAASTAELLPADAENIFRITGEADRAAIQLTALQNWAIAVTGSTAKGGDPLSQAHE